MALGNGTASILIGLKEKNFFLLAKIPHIIDKCWGHNPSTQGVYKRKPNLKTKSKNSTYGEVKFGSWPFGCFIKNFT